MAKSNIDISIDSYLNDASFTPNHLHLNLKGKDVLFFSSNRSGGKGGMDIWYTRLNYKGKEYYKPKNVRKVNSLDNDICPWCDRINQKLYF